MKNFQNFITDLSSLCKHPSVKASAQNDMPFGSGVQGALNEFNDIANKLGFKTKNYDNHILELSYGEGQEIGILGHLDVVPAGNGWNTDPFCLTEKDGVYFARGVHDDKGPTLLCLYALKEVIDSGIKFNKKIRFFVGTDEESGWEDIEYFNKHYGGFPEYGFSPDGHFPLTYAEKGIAPTIFTFPAFEKFTDLTGGVALNAVCDYATVKPLFIPEKGELDAFSLTFDGELIHSKGISAHGSEPHKGKNAMKPIFEYMAFKGEKVQNVLDCLFLDKHGVFNMVSEQGSVTLSPNVVKSHSQAVEILCDVRIPYPFTLEEVKQKFDLFGFSYQAEEHHKPTCLPKDGWFVNALLNSYNKITGENAKPISMGGSTYARAFKMGCSFGADFPNTDNSIHNSNERFTKEEMLKTFDIYRLAIENLVK